ncbi:hypothetical protein BGZ73_000130 [Actinomortierella ambigua]|nr:hypothetical protein BGZ73_000130 [Actinomortierella ambigua]
MYMNSKGITHSDFEALYWFRRAADLGHREAQFLIGQLYENDKVLYKDNSRAVQWYRLAARQGHTEAQERLDAIVKKRRRLCPDYAHSPSDDPDGPDAPACHYVPRTPHSSVDHVETDQVFTVPVLSRDDDKDDVDDSSGFSNEPPTGDTTDSGTGGLRGASPSAGSKAAEESRASSTSPLIIDEWIGGSESCPVYQVRSFVTTYAAKKFHIPYNEQHRNAFKQEIAALERLRHPNLIQLFDTHEQDGSLYLMMEFAASGSLTNAIAHSQLDWSLKVRITQDIARGLDYLHRKNIVHRNIKSNNILLTPGIVAKLCDVGLDSVTTTNRATPDDWMEGDEQRIEGNERWMAPELFADPPRYSTKSDMFAFGVVMWQMAAESVRPFLPLSIDKVAQVIQDGCREEIPDHTPAKYEMWIRKCWHQEFENRPEASDLVSFSMDPASLPSGHVSTLTLEGDGGDSMVPPFAGLTKDEIYAQRSMGVLRAKNALALLRRKRDTAASKDRRVDPEDERPGDAASTRDGVVDIPSKDARQSSFNLTHLLNECKELVRHGSTNQTRLQCALERISRLLGNTSSSSQALETSQSFRDDVVAAESVVSAATQLDPDTEATLQESAPTQVQSEFQRELAKLKTDLLRTEELREFLDREVPTKGRDATEEHGVEQELTNSKVVLDEASARPARFGCLYWATVGDGKMMLVKQLDEIYGTSKEATLRRVKALTHQLRHCKGILQIRAIQFPDLIIYGSQNAIPLDMYLSQNKLSLQDKWLVAFKMANALRYVHECNIIHRDIRAASVFMVETTPGVFEPKLAGFETCRSGMAVTVGSVDEDDVWKAPETRLGHGWSKEAGVFAFGILMYEITMGSPPQWNVNCTGTVYEKTKQNVADWIEKSYNTAPSPRYAVLMQKCLDADHMHRPTMENVFIELSEGF